ncbi:MAG: trigger factor [Thioploca sp.]|nr:trigger factor [Thioploca sp.]
MKNVIAKLINKDSIPENIFKLSVSKSKTFEDCAKKYKFTYIDKFPRKEWDFHIFGKFLHQILENFHRSILEKPEMASQWPRLLDDAWESAEEEYKSKLNKEQEDQASEIINHYKEIIDEEGLPNVISVEQPFNIVINDILLLNGFIDRVQIDSDGMLHVADYKTTKDKKYLKDFFQLETYAYALMLENDDINRIRASFIMLRHEFEYLTEEFTRKEIFSKIAPKFINYAEAIDTEKLWRANPQFLCKYCDHLERCREGNDYLVKRGKAPDIKPKVGLNKLVKENMEEQTINSKEIDYCTLSVSFTGDPDVIKQKESEAIKELKKIQIPGFRKGKAPDYAIKARCKDKINNWIAREMSVEAYDAMVFETGVKPIGQPEFKSINCKNGQYSCEMIVYHKPEFELKQYTAIEISKAPIKDLDTQIENAIIALRKRSGQTEPYSDEDIVEKGDDITMSFKALINQEVFDGSVVEGEFYTVGQNKFPDFDDYILGMKAGETREFSLVFPEDYPELGGKTAQFELTVHMGTKKRLAPLTEDFFKNCGVKDYDELKVNLSQIISVNMKQEEMNYIKGQVSEKLVEIHDFKVPEFLIDKEAQFQAMQRRIDKKSLEQDDIKNALREIAEKNCKLSLILDSIREEEPDAVLNDSEVQQRIMQHVMKQGHDPKKFFVEAERNGTLLGLVAALKDEFTLQWVIEQAKVINGKTETEEIRST